MTKAKPGRPVKHINCTLFPDIVSRKNFDRSGQKYGKLTFLYIVGRQIGKHGILWLCECDCGEEVFAIYGRATSCPDCREWGDTRRSLHLQNTEKLAKESARKKRNCHRYKFQFTCAHYRQCTDERGIELKSMSDRERLLGGNCYEPGLDQVKFEKTMEENER